MISTKARPFTSFGYTESSSSQSMSSTMSISQMLMHPKKVLETINTGPKFSPTPAFISRHGLNNASSTYLQFNGSGYDNPTNQLAKHNIILHPRLALQRMSSARRPMATRLVLDQRRTVNPRLGADSRLRGLV